MTAREPDNLRKVSLPKLDLRAQIEAHNKAIKLIPGTHIKAKIRTLLPKEN